MIPNTGTINLAAGSVEQVSSQIDVNQSLIINGNKDNKPTIENTRSGTATDKSVPAFKISTGDLLSLKDIKLKGKSYTLPNGTWWGNRMIEGLDGKMTWENVDVEDGEGSTFKRGEVQVDGGKIINSTYQYTLYLGDAPSSGDDYLVYGNIKNYAFLIGRKETALRLMGFRGKVSKCTFSATMPAKHSKETLQGRLGNFVIEGCKSWSTTFGSLDPSIESEAHVKYAERNPTYMFINTHEQTGYIKIDGKTFAAIDNLKITGPDPRGVGGTDVAIKTTTYNCSFGRQSPIIYIKNSSISGFTQFGSSLVIIGPNCTLNGTILPQSSNWSEIEFNRIKTEASKYVTSDPVVPPEPPEIKPSVQSFDIVLKDGTKVLTNINTNIDLSSLNQSEFSFVANGVSCNSIKFILDNQEERTENSAPYSLYGDAGSTFVVKPFNDQVYVLTGIGYSKPSGMGLPSDPLTIKILRSYPKTPEKKVSLINVLYSDGTTEGFVKA